MPDEKLKPLWLRKAMIVNVSNWCSYELVKEDGTTVPLPQDTILGVGLYTIEILVSHLYCGPHKNGDTCSLSLFISRIAYEPLSNLLDIFNDVSA